SSSPDVDDGFQGTVKRVAGGVVSNWMIDSLRPGDVIDTTCPAGVFCLGAEDTDVVAFAGGSGITPVFSIVKTALATTSRRVHLLYANRDRDSIIFGDELDRLAKQHPDRLDIVHHLDVEVDAADQHPGTTILQTARQMGMSAPSSCESGSCATCMARLVEGQVEMFVNNALTEDEVAEGWVLTCQSVPTTPTVHVVYE